MPGPNVLASRALATAIAAGALAGRAGAARVEGVAETGTTVAVAGSRVTLFTPELDVFEETRTDASGAYGFEDVSQGVYRLGCAARGFDYVEIGIIVAATDIVRDFALDAETEPGVWDSIGTTEPEFLDATDIGLLLPDGRIFYCHDTTDPILFDPVSGASASASASGTPQGCMNGSLLPDGAVILAGGQDGSSPGDFTNGIPWVKRYDPSLDLWTSLADLQHERGRWYPGMARLADGSFLVMGGGQSPDASRTDTCERLDLETLTWTTTGPMLNASEFTPSALLHTGMVLATWSPPQLYDPDAGLWRTTGPFVQPNRGWPGHSDHSLVVLAGGDVLAIGIRGHGNTFMGERYDPALQSWSPAANPALLRFQTELVQLPDGRVLVAGGETDVESPPVPDLLGIVKWTDLYDPDTDTWRRVADMREFREYHAVTLLIPDGRVVTTGGTNIKFTTGPRSSMVEAYAPPYLFRGVRPEITSVSDTSPSRGDELVLDIVPETRLTSVVLMGVESTTHWVSAGVPRRVVLPVSQSGGTATVTLPADPNLLPLGHYMVFAMVDDIPSRGAVVYVDGGEITSTGDGVPGESPLALGRAVPNPFRSLTTLSYRIDVRASVTVRMFDASGRVVRTLVDRAMRPPGTHALTWDGTNGEGVRVSAGVYAYTVRTGAAEATGRLTLVR